MFEQTSVTDPGKRPSRAFDSRWTELKRRRSARDKGRVPAVLLACGASLAWGAGDFVAGLRSRELTLISVLFVSQAVGLVLVIPALIAASPPSASYLGLAALTGALNAAALAALYRGLARGPMGIVAPIAAADSVVPVLYGLITGERPSTLVAFGIGLTLIGVIFAALPGGPDRNLWRRAAPASVALGIVAAICFGGFMIALKAASAGGTAWAIGFSRLTTVAIISGALLVTGARLSVRRRDLPALAATGALDVGATALFAVATTKGLLSVVGVVGSFYPVVTIALAGILLHERLGSRQRFGALGALTGVALIAVG